MANGERITRIFMKITAIVSDYDGTLCPTDSTNGSKGRIPEDLETVLWSISKVVPVCILSSKDFKFLDGKVGFSSVVTCLNGAEYFVCKNTNGQSNTTKYSVDTYGLKKVIGTCGTYYAGSLTNGNLEEKSLVLRKISKAIVDRFQDVTIKEKYRYTDNLLVGITIDYRHLKKWDQYKTNIEPYIIKLIRSTEREITSQSNRNFYIQQFLDHPFIDVYTFEAEKGSGLKKIKRLLKLGSNDRLLYLGDSESDNPAFLASDISIGIRSDRRLNVKLDSNYVLEFNELRPFLKNLQEHDFVFSKMGNNII